MAPRISRELREKIVRLYSELAAPARSDRAVSRDVAALAGVSPVTVLRYVKPDYRESP